MMLYSTPGGKLALSCSRRASHRLATSSALEPGSWLMPIIAVGISLTRAICEYESEPISTRAMSPRRSRPVPSVRSTTSANCSGVLSRPLAVSV